jgi:hypothetical protein
MDDCLQGLILIRAGFLSIGPDGDDDINGYGNAERNDQVY